MSYFKVKTVLVLLMLFQLQMHAQLSPQQMVTKMGRGINAGNVLSAPIEGNWAPAFTETYFQDIASAGFTAVRIPMDFFGSRTSGNTSGYSKNAGTVGSYTGTAADYVVSSTYLDRVEQVINWGLNQNLVVILDFHGATLKEEFLDTFDQSYAPALYTFPDSAKRAADNEKFRAIWTQIANRFKNYSYDLLFEIVNEPYFRMSATEMNILNTDIISIIRSTGGNNTSRNVIITGGGANSWQAPLQISSSILTSDSYLIPTFHYYLPFNFTSSGKERWTDNDWGTTQDKANVDFHFNQVQTWATNNNVPIFFGEFGADNTCGFNYITNQCGSFGGPDETSRVEYHSYLAEAAISRGFSFAAWDAGDKSNKSIYLVSSRSWVNSIRDALLGTTTTTTCTNFDIIQNANIECGVGINWSLHNFGSAVASLSAASSANSRNNTSIQIDVATADNLNSVILKNLNVDVSSLAGHNIEFSGYAKASTNALNMRVRLRVEDNVGAVSFPGKEIPLSSTDYSLWTYNYVLPANVKLVEFQVICGASVGSYFFDDFNVTNLTLSTNPVQDVSNVHVYPNPASDYLFINSETLMQKVEIIDVTGKKVLELSNLKTQQINISNLTKGIYFIKLYSNYDWSTKKIIKE